MIRHLAAAFVSLLPLGALASGALAQDAPRPVAEAVAQSDHDRPVADDRGLERARAAARASEGAEDDIDKARAAARATDPRLDGLEKARAAARGADAGGGVDCMSAREARGIVNQKKAITLAQAVRAARDAWDGEVIDYKLCTYDGRLAYELTLLAADGKVARARVEALDGKLVGVR